MPTAFSHAIVGISAGVAISNRAVPKSVFPLAVLCAIIPDIDVLCFKLGIPYGSFWGHRGVFHSLLFAVLFGFMTTAYLYIRDRIEKNELYFYGVFFSLVTASHGVLDAFTNGGLGIALLSPFNAHRYFFWTTPIAVSPLNPKAFLTVRGLHVLSNELLWVWMPMLFIALLGKFTFFRRDDSLACVDRI